MSKYSFSYGSVGLVICVGDLLNPRNCGYWNLAREDQTFETAPKAMICSLAKLMPIHRGGGVYQIALDNFIQRIKYGDWGHIFPEGRTYQVQEGYDLKNRSS